jgi:hypothetical protein
MSHNAEMSVSALTIFAANVLPEMHFRAICARAAWLRCHVR